MLNFEELLKLLRVPAPKPKGQNVGTGMLGTNQQYYYEKGWSEGIKAYRSHLKNLVKVKSHD